MGAKYAHMTEDDRYAIKNGLDGGETFKAIASKIGKDCTTVSKEVKARRVFRKTGGIGQKFNDCAHRFGCLENSLCTGKICKGRRCRNCHDVYCGDKKLCERFEREFCPQRDLAPYVCNGCHMRIRCTLEKAFYEPRGAQREYEGLRHDARAGFDLDEAEVCRLNAIVSPLLKKGQSLHHICANNASKIMLSERAMYNYVNASLFDARNIDMPRKVRYKKRKQKREAKVDKGCVVGRTYEDYLAFRAGNPDISVVEMDTVHGSQGGKALLTLHFVDTHFMLAILIDGLTAFDVALAFKWLRRTLGFELYGMLFVLILTDRGSEFSNPKDIEFDEEGEGRTRLFYCDPQQSQQKGSAEKNHSEIRRVLPKGTSFDNLCQDDITLMMNHVNSYGRKSLNNRPPMELFRFIYGSETLEMLGAELVPADDIVLRPSLLKR
jgi:IS30 family transposase